MSENHNEEKQIVIQKCFMMSLILFLFGMHRTKQYSQRERDGNIEGEQREWNTRRIYFIWFNWLENSFDLCRVSRLSWLTMRRFLMLPRIIYIRIHFWLSVFGNRAEIVNVAKCNPHRFGVSLMNFMKIQVVQFAMQLLAFDISTTFTSVAE